MICNDCGSNGDWIGDDAHWETVTDGAAALSLYQCSDCGNTQRGR